MMDEAIWKALEDAGDDDDLADVWADAYYHCSITQGVVFAALIRPGSPIPAKADGRGHAEEFVSRILHRHFGVDPDHARTIAAMLQGAFHGGSHTWLRDEAARSEVVQTAADVVRGVVASAPRCERHDHTTETCSATSASAAPRSPADRRRRSSSCCTSSGDRPPASCSRAW